MSTIDKQTLEHLAKLARIELGPEEEAKLMKDLASILDYFKELQELKTEHVTPMTGGTDLKNIFRDDTERENTDQGAGAQAFPEKEGGYLKIPPVFDNGGQ